MSTNFDIKRATAIKKGARVALREASWGLEMKAMEAVEQGDTKRACDLLLCAVRHDLEFLKSEPRRPSFRLYDLLAGLSIRVGTDHCEAMRKELAAAKVLQAFQYRLATWDDKEARWRKRWTGKNPVWITSVAATKKSKEEKKDFKAESEKKRLRLPT